MALSLFLPSETDAAPCAGSAHGSSSGTPGRTSLSLLEASRPSRRGGLPLCALLSRPKGAVHSPFAPPGEGQYCIRGDGWLIFP